MEWLKSNAGDIIVIAILLAIVGGIISRMIRNRRVGKTGCSACSGCSGCCCINCGNKGKTAGMGRMNPLSAVFLEYGNQIHSGK